LHLGFRVERIIASALYAPGPTIDCFIVTFFIALVKLHLGAFFSALVGLYFAGPGENIPEPFKGVILYLFLN